MQHFLFSAFTQRQSNTNLCSEHHRLGAGSFLCKITALRTSPVREGKILGWLYCLMFQITHFAFLEKKSILAARLSDHFHHRQSQTALEFLHQLLHWRLQSPLTLPCYFIAAQQGTLRPDTSIQVLCLILVRGKHTT